jgi:16S rRNA (cytosine1402-N4)-methyltransferase
LHQTVLSQESIDLLQPRAGLAVIDCTLGGAGHAQLLLRRIQPGGRLLGIDRDAAAVAAAGQKLCGFEPAPILAQGNFSQLAEIAREVGIAPVGAVLFDLGISSDQLDEPGRGFSFRQAGPLDMRMDRAQALTAEELLNSLPERALAEIIRGLGEERWAARVAQFIVRRRPLRTTLDLAHAVEAAIPRSAWPRDIHPATRTFQAVRMKVNDELGSLEQGLEAAVSVLGLGGRLAVISFHSLEDGLVKRFFQREARDCLCPAQQPVCTCKHRAQLQIVTKRPVRPSDREVATNPRSRSARLRVAQRI